MSEKAKANGDDAAFACMTDTGDGTFGMTKREDIAKAAMQGILTQTQEWAPEFVAVKAVAMADALLRRLEES